MNLLVFKYLNGYLLSSTWLILNHTKELLYEARHLSGLIAHTDGGKGGFGTVVFVSATEDKNSDALKNINMGSKSRVSRRTIPCHETLSKPFSLETTMALAKPLSTREEFEDASLDFIVANDSVCAALLFKPGLSYQKHVAQKLC